MTNKIDQKITGFKVIKNEESVPAEIEVPDEHINEHVQRPDLLIGSTYKISSPNSKHALYVTINDIVLNEGTENERKQMYEIFINSKNMEHFQWVVALTRVISAVFRKGGKVTFLTRELKATFDPQGGYFKRGGKFMPSLVAEIGEVIEDHMQRTGRLKGNTLDKFQQKLVDEKRAEYESKQNIPASDMNPQFPPGATLCPKCQMTSTIIMDGCATCLNCGESKCG